MRANVGDGKMQRHTRQDAREVFLPPLVNERRPMCIVISAIMYMHVHSHLHGRALAMCAQARVQARTHASAGAATQGGQASGRSRAGSRGGETWRGRPCSFQAHGPIEAASSFVLSSLYAQCVCLDQTPPMPRSPDPRGEYDGLPVVRLVLLRR